MSPARNLVLLMSTHCRLASTKPRCKFHTRQNIRFQNFHFCRFAVIRVRPCSPPFEIDKPKGVGRVYMRRTAPAGAYWKWRACELWTFVLPPGSYPNHTFYRQPTLVLVCCRTRTRWINKAIWKVIYHTRIRSVAINFLGESIRGGIKRNGSMCRNKLTPITSPRLLARYASCSAKQIISTC